MPVITRTYPTAKFPNFSCQPLDIECGDIYSETIANNAIGDLTKLAKSGKVVAQGHSRVINGLTVPHNGFCTRWALERGTGAQINGYNRFANYYETVNVFETTDLYTNWLLMGTVKLYYIGLPYGRFGRIDFKLYLYDTTGNILASQTLAVIRPYPTPNGRVPNNSGGFTSDPALGYADLRVPMEIETDFVFTGPLFQSLIPMPGNGQVLELRTHISHELYGVEDAGSNASGGYFSADYSGYGDYWAGIKHHSLKFFRNCI